MTDKDDHAIDEEAVKWFVVLQDEDAGERVRQRFQEWRHTSPAHEKAWLEVERLWEGLDQLADKNPSIKNLTLSSRAAARQPVSLSPKAYRARPPWKVLQTAASLLLAAAVGWWLMPVGIMADYRAGVGERRIVNLDDGSVIELGTSSAIDVSFGEGQRTVKLLGGEAFFTVVRDAQRPFVVLAQDGQIRVLGTAFDVRIGDGVTVTVTHHSVEVTAASEKAHVEEGQFIRYNGDGVSRVETADVDSVGAWRRDQLVFKDTPLRQVISELQRYRRGHIQLLNKAIGNLRVTAVFDARRTDAALDTIATSLNLRVYRATDLLVGIGRN